MFDGMPGPDGARGPALPTKPLIELCTFRGGGTPSKRNASFWTDGTIPWVSPKDMKSDVIRDAEDKITAVAVEESATNVVPEGAILVVTRSGILKHTLPVGVTALPVALNQDLKALVPKKGTDANFIAWFLRSRQHDILANCTKDGTTVASVDTKKLKDYPVPFLPLADQRRIVSRIEELFSQVEAGERAIGDARRDLARYRRSVLHAAITGALTKDWRAVNPAPEEDGPALLARLATERRAAWERAELAKLDAKGKPRPKTEKEWKELRGRFKEYGPSPDDEEGTELPETWDGVLIGSLFDVATGATPKKGTDRYYEEGDIPWLTSTCANLQKVRKATQFITDHAIAETNCKLFPIGTMIIAMYGEGKTRGKITELRLSAATNQACAALLPSGLPRVVRDFTRLNFEVSYDRNRSKAAGGVQPNLSLGLIKDIRIPMPPLAETAEIVSRVAVESSRADAAEATLDVQARAARALKQSILKAAFAGQLA